MTNKFSFDFIEIIRNFKKILGVKIKILKPYIIIIILIFLLTDLLFSQYQRTIKVAAFQHKPAIFMDKDSIIKGFYVDILEEIAYKENWKLEFIYGSWEQGIERLKSGEIDLITSAAYTPERAEFMDYCSEPSFTVWSILYSRKNLNIENIIDVKGKKIGLMKKDVNAKNFIEMCNKFNIQFIAVYFDNFEQIFQNIAIGLIDGGITPNTFGFANETQYNVERTSVFINPFHIYFATHKDKNKDILNKIDLYLKKWKSEDNSFYHLTINKWLYKNNISNDNFIELIYYFIGGILIVLIIALIIIRILKQKISKATSSIIEINNSLKEEIENRNKYQNYLEIFLELGTQLYDEQFFNKMTKKLSDVLNVNFVFISLIDDSKQNLKVISGFLNNSYIDSFTYPISDTPCESIFNEGTTIIHDNIYEKYPNLDIIKDNNFRSYIGVPLINSKSEKIGILAVFDINRIENSTDYLPMLQFFSRRIATEIERNNTEEALKRAKESLIEANNLKQIILANLAHELRTPLNSILGFSNLLKESFANTENEEIFGYIISSADRLKRTLNSILLLIDLESTKSLPKIDKMCLNNLKHFFNESLVKILYNKGLKFEFSINIDEYICINANDYYLENIIWNVFDNSIKYSEKGIISVSIYNKIIEDNNYGVISIKDEGTGINDDKLRQIFEPFRQGIEGFNRPYEGLGIGLTITKKMMDLMNANIEIRSEIGRGTQVDLIFLAKKCDVNCYKFKL